jgi:hypothetical protein
MHQPFLLVSAPVSKNWRDLYLAALFEVDQRRMCSRITDAEKAIVERSRALIAAGCNIAKERQALDSSMDALRSLRSCLNQSAISGVVSRH